MSTGEHVRAAKDEAYVPQTAQVPAAVWQAPAPLEPASAMPATSSECYEALLCHVGALLTSFILPLILLLVRREKSRFVAHHAREALNLEVTLTLVAIGGTLLCAIVGFVGATVTQDIVWVFIATGLWWIMALLVTLWETILVIVASVASCRGLAYRYPLILRIVR